jgi:hypothetical protein
MACAHACALGTGDGQHPMRARRQAGGTPGYNRNSKEFLRRVSESLTVWLRVSLCVFTAYTTRSSWQRQRRWATPDA